MKIAVSLIAVALAGFAGIYFLHGPIHGTNSTSNEQSALVNYFHGEDAAQGELGEDGSVTFSIRQNDYDLCTDQFWVDLYDLTVEEFAVGAEQVVLADYQDRIFSYVRTTENFHYGDREGWVDHIKDIPAQMIDIIVEDSAVLDSCANFSVALVGPP